MHVPTPMWISQYFPRRKLICLAPILSDSGQMSPCHWPPAYTSVCQTHLVIQVVCGGPGGVLSEPIEQSLDQEARMHSGQLRELWEVLQCDQRQPTS